MTIDDILAQVQPQLQLEAEAEHEVLEEIRGHLEEAVSAARARGLDEQAALAEAARGFGIEPASAALHQTRRGWGTYEGIAAAALPVLFALILRWLIFDPSGTAVSWREMLSAPVLVIIAGVAVLIPLLRFSQRRYALVLWLFFWGLSLITVIYPTMRW